MCFIYDEASQSKNSGQILQNLNPENGFWVSRFTLGWTGWNKRRPNRSRKGNKDRKNRINKKQERNKEDSTQGEYAFFLARKQRGGGVAPRQNDIIRHQREQGSEKKNEKSDTKNNRKNKT